MAETPSLRRHGKLCKEGAWTPSCRGQGHQQTSKLSRGRHTAGTTRQSEAPRASSVRPQQIRDKHSNAEHHRGKRCQKTQFTIRVFFFFFGHMACMTSLSQPGWNLSEMRRSPSRRTAKDIPTTPFRTDFSTVGTEAGGIPSKW